MQGKIIKGIAGFYYVYTEGGVIYTCRAKGIFRKDGRKPLVGDDVEMSVIDSEAKEGNVDKLLPRRSELIRPAVANVDQALVIFAINRPEPNFNLLDRFLIMMRQQNLPSVICFNKEDIANDSEKDLLTEAYGSAAGHLLFTSAKTGEGIDELKGLLQHKTTVMAGPSGVGKSSITNRLHPSAEMETGDISKKIGRGKHTTRHSELFGMDDDTFIMDTPGFSSLDLFDLEKEELQSFYPEFAPFEAGCRFQGCMHIAEPVCGVKEALSEGKISKLRYDIYCQLFEELRNKRKY
ncbi:MAG: ribosome small subunit-dependent GTPase A [Lachnospiraceae bacterium]|nr:ribosome small subunit-dependent GTPase A [Lachnospiraceae bacterium]